MNDPGLAPRHPPEHRLERLARRLRITRSLCLLLALVVAAGCCLIAYACFVFLFAPVWPQGAACSVPSLWEQALLVVTPSLLTAAFGLNAAALVVDRFVPRVEAPATPYRTAASAPRSPR